MIPRSIHAGDLCFRCIIQEPVEIRGTSGGSTEQMVTVAKDLPCKVEYLKSRESFIDEAQRVTLIDTCVFTIRYRTDITERNIILYDGKIWDIAGIKTLGRREGLAITAVSVR